MLIERIWAANDYRNFHYLIACPETGEALAVDPLEWRLCLDAARNRGWEITQILNTHEHRDHTGGNQGLVAATGARVLAHAGAASRIGGVDRGLQKGDVIRVGRTVELECLDTPGHTLAHICLFAHTDEPALFCGDTLFNAGAGNCHSSGRPDLLYETFVGQLARLPDNTRVYPGHEYLARNLEFTLDREPDNSDAKALLERSRNHDPAKAVVTTLGEEKRINTFFRLQNPTVIARLREVFPEIGEQPDPKTVFLKLRELRNRW
ncbi:MAG: hydroxyacylglutathione hydrolase C-terminal domain-containing protein [Pseudomonadota bacterium]|jgi:Zn-dependent hydrolases, including glyoxylases|nr:MAG: hydroxyacylglutathione hydrolase [Pseudomonadota bacterium]